jgi:hypothetical protein
VQKLAVLVLPAVVCKLQAAAVLVLAQVLVQGAVMAPCPAL